MNTPPSRRDRCNFAGVAVPGFYDEFSPLGSVSSPEERARQRERQGYCTTCQQNPIKLFDIKKNKLNPLRRTKEPRTVLGQSFEGKCLACNPHLDPNRSIRGLSVSSRKLGLGSSSHSRICLAGKTSPTLSTAGSSKSLLSGSSQESRSSPVTPGRARPLQNQGSFGSQRSVSGNCATPLRSSRSLRTQDHLTVSSAGPPPPRRSESSSPDSSTRSSERSSSRSMGDKPRSIRFSSDFIQQQTLCIPLPEDAQSDSVRTSESTQSSSSSSVRYAPVRRVSFSEEESTRSLQVDRRSGYYDNVGDRHESCPNFRLGGERRAQRRPEMSPTFSARTGQMGLDCSTSSHPDPSGDSRGASTPSPLSTVVDDEEAEVAELKVLINDLGGNAECTADVLANAIRTKPPSESMKIFFLENVCSSCKHNEGIKSFFISVGIHDDVLNTMERNLDNARVQELGCGAVWTMAVNDRNRRFLGKAGAAECVYRALKRHESSEKVVLTAMSALRTLSPERSIQQELVQYNCATLVSRVMGLHTSVVRIQRDGCAFLSNSAVNMETKSVSVVSFDEVKAVVRAMRCHSTNEAVTSSACFALKNYTFEEQNLRTMRRFSDVMELLRYVSIYGNSSSSRQDAVDIIEALKLSEKMDKTLETIVVSSFGDAINGPDAVSNLMGIIKDYDWSPLLICNGLDSLSKLAEESDSHGHKVLESTVLEEIVECMNEHEADAEIQHRCCKLLHCAASNSQGRSAVCRTEACTPIVHAMQNHSEVEQIQAAAVKTLLALVPEVRFASETQENEMMATLQDALQHYPHNAELQQAGAEVVASLYTRK